jgi:hypothetical protein
MDKRFWLNVATWVGLGVGSLVHLLQGFNNMLPQFLSDILSFSVGPVSVQAIAGALGLWLLWEIKMK